MKRILYIIIIVFVIVVMLVGCKKQQHNNSKPNTNTDATISEGDEGPRKNRPTGKIKDKMRSESSDKTTESGSEDNVLTIEESENEVNSDKQEELPKGATSDNSQASDMMP